MTELVERTDVDGFVADGSHPAERCRLYGLAGQTAVHAHGLSPKVLSSSHVERYTHLPAAARLPTP